MDRIDSRTINSTVMETLSTIDQLIRRCDHNVTKAILETPSPLQPWEKRKIKRYYQSQFRKGLKAITKAIQVP